MRDPNRFFTEEARLREFGQTLEQAGFKPKQMRIKGKVMTGAICRLLPKGQYNVDDMEFEEARTSQMLDDGTLVLREGQQEAVMQDAARGIEEVLSSSIQLYTDQLKHVHGRVAKRGASDPKVSTAATGSAKANDDEFD